MFPSSPLCSIRKVRPFAARSMAWDILLSPPCGRENVFDIEIAPGAGREQAQREMDQIARDVLANPVIEDYSIEFSD